MPMEPPLETKRLVLRIPESDDAPVIEELAGDVRVAQMIPVMPHPYPTGAGVSWVEAQRQAWADGQTRSLAITRKPEPALIGVVTLHLHPANRNAELGYWVGPPHWGNGYASEAAGDMVRYGFEDLNLARIYATALTRNPASRRVLEKIGMRHEGDSADMFLCSGNWRTWTPSVSCAKNGIHSHAVKRTSNDGAAEAIG